MKRLALVAVMLVAFAAPAGAHVPLPREPISLHFASCPDHSEAAGCYVSGGSLPNPVIYLRYGEPWILWHELGHSFDHSVLRDVDRDRIRYTMRRSQPWPELAETFADAYASCATHDFFPEHYSRRTHRTICRLIWRSASGA